MIRDALRPHGVKLTAVYILTLACSFAGLLYPLATAKAIDGVLAGDWRAVFWLAGCHAAVLILAVADKRYDTRVFTRVYSEVASRVVATSRAEGLDEAIVAARASLSREYINFLERDVQAVITAILGITISLSAIFAMQPIVGAACVGLIPLLTLISRDLARKSKILNAGLNHRLEREVLILRNGRNESTRRHFNALAGWRIHLSDAEAKAFGLMEVTVIVLFTTALWQLGAAKKTSAGEIYAVFSYIWRYVGALDQAPRLIQQVAKLQDLNERFSGRKKQ